MLLMCQSKNAEVLYSGDLVKLRLKTSIDLSLQGLQHKGLGTLPYSCCYNYYTRAVMVLK